MSCDIIIPVWNLIDFTRDCIESVLSQTEYPFHLIVIDNGSDSETKEYLFKLAQQRKNEITLIRNENNLGFIKATNQGIRASKAPYLCLLNNDTIVTKGWLREMVKLATSREDIGIVNPSSNTLGCNPKRGDSLESFAEERKSYSGEYSELAWATGFCMLIKRKIIEEVGLLDEVYGMGNFEDADFCKRAQKQGYLSVCAKAAYVHHQERRSFIRFKKFNQNFEDNKQTFYAKWGSLKRILYVLNKEDHLYIERIGAEALKLAREGNIVWIFSKGRDKLEIRKHSNIYVYNRPKPFFNLTNFLIILKRKKKFDKIYVNSKSYAKRLNSFKYIHKAEVICAE
ncbi:MAG: glycosyltransferase family 2 protein [Candidatus Omnitrophica bacterium]|nr:glycosyltransferase family 2 protein [Candidatus Omnitrophota bacterium]